MSRTAVSNYNSLYKRKFTMMLMSGALVLGAAVAFEATKAFEDHQKKEGKEVKHEKLKVGPPLPLFLRESCAENVYL